MLSENCIKMAEMRQEGPGSVFVVPNMHVAPCSFASDSFERLLQAFPSKVLRQAEFIMGKKLKKVSAGF